jgi:CheY-like chemotaxis protein
MKRKTRGLHALFGDRHDILFCTHLEPERWWRASELALHAHVAKSSLAPELDRLLGGEILRCRGQGATLEYQANPECPFFAEIQAMMAKAATPEVAAGSVTILVVDDQPATLKVARILLESFGYRVLAAESGQQALILFRQHARQVRLILTDVVMPDITGPQLVEKLHRIDPGLRVIFMSGYSGGEELQPGSGFLAKPFNPAGLSKAVREALDRE